MGHTASVQIFVDGTRMLYDAYSDNGDSEKTGHSGLYITAGQTVRVVTNESYYSVVTLTVKTAQEMLLFFQDGASIAAYGFNDDTEYFSNKKLTGASFDSSSHVEFALSTGWAEEIPEINRLYTCVPNQSIEYNGQNTSIIYLIKRSNSLEIMCKDGKLLSLEYGADSSEFETVGWYWISGTIGIAEMQRGVHTANLIPVDGASIGDGDNRYAQGYFEHVNADSVAGNLTGNVNDETMRNSYKVWGAVAN